jgi:N-acetylneuraminic acid mutarotase
MGGKGGATIEGLEGRLLFHGSFDAAAQPAPQAGIDLNGAFHLRLNAGGPEFVDSGGNTWERDEFARGGRRSRRLFDVGATGEDALFARQRTGRSFRYAIPVPAPGAYTLSLLLADPKYTAAGMRRFDVTAEGQPLATGLDVAAAGGGRSAIVLSYPLNIGDGALDLAFHGTLRAAIVSGIELLQNDPPVAPPASWQETAPLPQAMFESQGAVAGDRLFLFGGFFNGDVQATHATYAYDPTTNTWSQRADLPEAVTHAGVAADGATVWLVGGLVGDYNGGTNAPTASVWKYDATADAWSAGPALPAPGAAGGTALVGRALHYFGGFAADGQSDTGVHWVLNVDDPAATWKRAAPMPVARNHFGTAVLGGRIYAIGGQHGRDETSSNLRDVHVYNPVNNRWSAAARLPRPMSHFHPSTQVVNGKILIAGGVTNGRVPLAEAWEYDPATPKWSAAPPLPAPRKAPVMGVIGNTIYVAGGSPGDNFPQTTVWSRPT